MVCVLYFHHFSFTHGDDVSASATERLYIPTTRSQTSESGSRDLANAVLYGRLVGLTDLVKYTYMNVWYVSYFLLVLLSLTISCSKLTSNLFTRRYKLSTYAETQTQSPLNAGSRWRCLANTVPSERARS